MGDLKNTLAIDFAQMKAQSERNKLFFKNSIAQLPPTRISDKKVIGVRRDIQGLARQAINDAVSADSNRSTAKARPVPAYEGTGPRRGGEDPLFDRRNG